MTRNEFVQLEMKNRYERIQFSGKKLVTLHDPQYVVQIYALSGFYVELRLDSHNYGLVSADPFAEDHPRFEQYRQEIEAAIGV